MGDQKTKPDAQFVLIIQDVGGNVEVAGVMEPEQEDLRYVSHMVAAWMSARGEALIRQIVSQTRPPPAVIPGDRERTIILPEGGE